MSSIIGLKELRENTGRYIAATERGHSFTVVRRSRPVFKMIPVDKWGDEGQWETVLDLTKGKYKNMTAGELLTRFREIDARQTRKVSKKARR
jgi:prevent-host-death family protein